MSFASGVSVFAAQAARERRDVSNARVRRYVNGAATGATFSVFLSAVHAEREIADNGFIVTEKAQLRALKTLAWQPAEGDEFINVATSEIFRCGTAVGGSSDFAAEIVCEVVKIGG